MGEQAEWGKELLLPVRYCSRHVWWERRVARPRPRCAHASFRILTVYKTMGPAFGIFESLKKIGRARLCLPHAFMRHGL
jgi:hypothetical protein